MCKYQHISSLLCHEYFCYVTSRDFERKSGKCLRVQHSFNGTARKTQIRYKMIRPIKWLLDLWCFVILTPKFKQTFFLENDHKIQNLRIKKMYYLLTRALLGLVRLLPSAWRGWGVEMAVSAPIYLINPRTAGGLSHLRTAGGGGHICAPRLTRKLRNASTSGKKHSIDLNPISGRLLATPISGRGGGCLGPPLISPVLTGRFLKFKRHSFRLNMIYISKKKKFQKFVKGGY